METRQLLVGVYAINVEVAFGVDWDGDGVLFS